MTYIKFLKKFANITHSERKKEKSMPGVFSLEVKHSFFKLSKLNNSFAIFTPGSMQRFLNFEKLGGSRDQIKLNERKITCRRSIQKEIEINIGQEKCSLSIVDKYSLSYKVFSTSI